MQNRSLSDIVNRLMACLLALALAIPMPLAAAPVPVEKWNKGKLPIRDLSEDEAILHALNRLAFGPRPGDVERVRKMGLEKWIEQQLAPESLNDSALDARLKRYPTIEMSSAKLLNDYPRPEDALRRAGMSREEIQKMMEERRKQQEERQRQMGSGEMDPAARQRLRDRDPNGLPRGLEDVRNPQRIIFELGMAKTTRAIYSERQLNEVLADFWFNHFNVFAQKGPDRWLITEYEREAIRPNTMGKFGDLLRATAKSPAMLFYLDNWMSADPEAFSRMENELMQRRQRFMGLFGDAPLPMGRGGRVGQQRPGQRPGMQRPGQMPGQQQGQLGRPGQPGQVPPQRQRRGLNENYARELMELHTLGVDGGYTQQDIIEVARAFTGWTMRAPRQNPEFQYEDRIHDKKSKTILGKKFDGGGMKEGEQVLDFLAHHPNTAKFVSTKLARRFVADQPPQALVDRMAKSFLDSGGDIRVTMHTMIYSPEFWSRDVYRAKIKRPFELIVSTARAMNADVDIALPLVQWANRIGEPLYMCQPPTGYSDKAEAWVNTGALLNRLNYALALAGGRMRGTRVDAESLLDVNAQKDPQMILSKAIDTFLAGQVSKETRGTLEKQLNDPQVLRATLDDRVMNVDAGVIAGLVLGTPEFQRR